jgi:hypothetical protein
VARLAAKRNVVSTPSPITAPVVLRHMSSSKSEMPLAKVPAGHPFFDLIQSAYRVFDYPKPTSTEVCQNCCMDSAIEADFFRPAIAELPLRYVRDWYSGAYDPNGIAKETWGYLLPRVLEILASGESPSDNGIEVSLSRFRTGDPANWSVKEWEVLDQFQRQFLMHRIEHEDDALDDVLCAQRLGGWSLAGLLDQVAAVADAKLAARFWHDWCRWNVDGGSVWITSFWESPDNTTVHEFYTSRQMYTRMETLALADETEIEIAKMASSVAGIIEISAV